MRVVQMSAFFSLTKSLLVCDTVVLVFLFSYVVVHGSDESESFSKIKFMLRLVPDPVLFGW